MTLFTNPLSKIKDLMMNRKEKRLPLSFFDHPEVTYLAKSLIGKVLCTRIENITTKGMIVETEAYSGSCDAASHAYPLKRTPRNEIMFGPPGYSYVYLCYGIHSLFNIVTNKKNHPDAILIRAIEPLEGIDEMRKRRPKVSTLKDLANGPGKVSKALGIHLEHNAIPLNKKLLWLEDWKTQNLDIIASPRIGVEYAGEDAKLPWRFCLSYSKFVSRPYPWKS